LVAPLVKGFTWAIENATTGGHSIQVIGATGTGVTIANGYTITVYCDGTNYVTLPSASGGTVLGVTGTAPVASSGGTNPVISMAQANGSTNGYLASADWSTFNGKQNALGYTPAHSGANADITSLTGLTTPLTTSEGGSGTAGGTGYRYGNGASPDTYSTTIPASAGVITLGGALSCSNVTMGSGAGTGATCSAVSGYDSNFVVEIQTGSSPAPAAQVFVITFTASRGHVPACVALPVFIQYSSLAQIPSTALAYSTSMYLYSQITPLPANSVFYFTINCP
jgi:hypothetical protein